MTAHHDRDSDLVFAAALAERVIDCLGPDAPSVVIERVGYYDGFDETSFTAIFSEEPRENVLIEIGIGDPVDRQGAYFTVVAPHEEAVAATATHIQEHVFEHSRGAPLPPCPGHPHPLDPKVHDGIASWVCPADPAHHVEPILPAGEGTAWLRE